MFDSTIQKKYLTIIINVTSNTYVKHFMFLFYILSNVKMYVIKFIY